MAVALSPMECFLQFSVIKLICLTPLSSLLGISHFSWKFMKKIEYINTLSFSAKIVPHHISLLFFAITEIKAILTRKWLFSGIVYYQWSVARKLRLCSCYSLKEEKTQSVTYRQELLDFLYFAILEAA